MKIAVYGATGQVGGPIVAEAARRGHQVTAVSRRRPTGTLPRGATWKQGDATDPTEAASMTTPDAVVIAFGPSRDPATPNADFFDQFTGFLFSLAGTRVLVVGGAGSLLDEKGTRLLDAPSFPDDYRPEALAHAQILDHLRTAEDIEWTYLSPAPQLTSGPRTGRYITGGDHPAGPSISISDLAIAVVDELEQDRHRRSRWTAATG